MCKRTGHGQWFQLSGEDGRILFPLRRADTQVSCVEEFSLDGHS
jgi:hypothetical protein